MHQEVVAIVEEDVKSKQPVDPRSSINVKSVDKYSKAYHAPQVNNVIEAKVVLLGDSGVGKIFYRLKILEKYIPRSA